MTRSSDPFAAPDEPTRRREARQRAVELLYEAEMKSCELSDVLAEQISDLDPFALELATGVANQQEALTERLAGLLNVGWTPQRLGICDRLILLQGLFELERGLLRQPWSSTKPSNWRTAWAPLIAAGPS